jgi:hypothetical protein
MRYIQVESRRNPEKNKRDRLSKGLNELLNYSSDNAFITFTKIPKIGINPKSNYNTPIGIYAYPFDDLTKDQIKSNDIPFAGGSPYVTLFHARGNIINLKAITNTEARDYIEKAYDVFKIPETVREFINDYVEEYAFEVTNMAASHFWYTTMIVAQYLKSVHTRDINTEINSSFIHEPIRPAVWTKVFLAIGVDGCVDDGMGIIHRNEPHQAVFFKAAVLSIVTRVSNIRNKSISVGTPADLISIYNFFTHQQGRFVEYNNRYRTIPDDSPIGPEIITLVAQCLTYDTSELITFVLIDKQDIRKHYFLNVGLHVGSYKYFFDYLDRTVLEPSERYVIYITLQNTYYDHPLIRHYIDVFKPEASS